MRTYHHFINGAEVEPAGKQWLDSIDPYLGKPWALIAKGTAADVDQAVRGRARMREGPWPKMKPTERGNMLRLADLVAKNAERLSEIEVRDNGKLLAEMRAQLNYHAEVVVLLRRARRQDRRRGDADRQAGRVAFTRHEPVGVVAAITPWNSPLLLTPGRSRRHWPPAAPWS